NDLEILAEVRRHQNARVFAMGFGHAPNRFLLDRMAELGRGEVEYVAPDGDGSAAARRFHERVRSPLLTDITIEWNGLPVSDVEPRRLPDLFSAKPLFVTGRYAAGGRGLVRLRGRMAGRDVVRELEVELPDVEPRHEVLATLWARRRIEALMARNFEGVQQGVVSPPLEAAITELGLRFRLLTQFTSFVAVEERAVNRGGELRMIEVPVEAPGVDQRDSAPLAGYGPSGAPAAGVETANAFSMSEMIRNVGPVQIALTLALLLASLACLRFALGRAPTLWLRWRHTRRFAPALNSALRDGRIEEVLALSEECRRAPRAEVVRAGLQCWHARGPGESPSELEIKLSQSAAERLIAMRGYEERRRLSWLASVGTTAPLVGLFATVWGLIAVLSGAGYAEAAGIGAVAGGVAEALLPTALSLGVAVAAVWLHCYFSRQTDECVFEMSCAAADVRDYLLKRRVARSRVGGRQGA
ncbi:MAG: MotA/TolQ/ExbB proton channel family protein, partial [Pyrinomonadaceae bacterium]